MIVSVLLITHNEAENLPRCLDALRDCDDVVIVDSGSTDGTVEIARRYGARVLHHPFEDFASQRNFGLIEGGLKHDWVLHLDADEVLTPEFRRALAELSPAEGIDAYRVASKTILFGKWLRRAGMYPSYQVRLGRRDGLRFVQVGHGQREDLPPDRIATFPEPYLHYAFSHGLAAWFRKHVTYAEAEARMLVQSDTLRGARAATLFSGEATERRRALKNAAGRLPLLLRPAARFAYVYLLRGGILDGLPGAAYSVMLAVYEGMIAVLALELRRAERSKREPT